MPSSKRSVIPAPHHVRDKLQPESRVPGENRDLVFEMVPDFCRDDVWMPDQALYRSGEGQVRHGGKSEFMDRL